jgi:hypothetical protein
MPWRRGRWPLLVGTLTVVALLVHNLGPNVAVSLWNPHVPLLPWLCAVLLAWDVALGHRRALWWQPGERYDRLLTIAVDPGAALPPDAVTQCENDPTARKLAEYSALAPEDIAWLARFANERFFDPGSATRANWPAPRSWATGGCGSRCTRGRGSAPAHLGRPTRTTSVARQWS